jgi:hypothetical protein
MYKPKTINNTQFWNTSFSESSGLLPTFASTTGVLGILSWLAFIALFLHAGFKLFFTPRKEEILDIKMVIFYIMSLYLFIASLFYPIGSVLFLLAFVFLGVFIGLSTANKTNGEIVFSFLHNTKKSFFAILFLVVVMIVSVSIVFKYIERFISISYFQRAIRAETIDVATSNINKAVLLYSNDLYFRTYARIYLLKANSLVSKATEGTTLTDTEKADFQTSFDQALRSAQLAVEYNKMNYLNYEMLGSVYEAGVSFGATDAYDKAVSAYESASTFNPFNPGLKLNLARLFFANNNTRQAKDSANEALSLKQDYADALITLSQIAKSEGNNEDAISYAKKAVDFYPENQDLKQYLNSIK